MSLRILDKHRVSGMLARASWALLFIACLGAGCGGVERVSQPHGFLDHRGQPPRTHVLDGLGNMGGGE